MRMVYGVVLVCLMAAGVVAQEAKAPALDETGRLLVDGVVKSARIEQLALEALKRTPEYKAYEDAQKTRQTEQSAIQARLEKQYPGFTVDWSKRVLVVKPAQTAKQ